jgi:hypothetical protein
MRLSDLLKPIPNRDVMMGMTLSDCKPLPDDPSFSQP